MFPILVLLYFDVLWNINLSMNAAFLLLLAMFILEGSLVNFTLMGSLLTKLTPVGSASFYQGINFTVLHFGVLVGRLIAGATFAKLPMMYTCFGLTICWLFSMLWLSIECKNFPGDGEHHQWVILRETIRKYVKWTIRMEIAQRKIIHSAYTYTAK